MEEELEAELQSMVQQYGFSRVAQVMEDIKQAEAARDRVPKSGDLAKSQSMSPRARPPASTYAAKLELAPEKRSLVIELASRFEAKTFVPTMGDVRNFFRFYGIDGGRLRSRGAAMVRIFKALASMDETEVKRILDDRLFSGPSRMEPIADAIRRVSLK